MKQNNVENNPLCTLPTLLILHLCLIRIFSLSFSAMSPLLFAIVMEAISREFRVALPRELLYADDLVVIAETEEDLIKRLNEWKNNVENKGMRVNMNKTKVMISGERQKPVQGCKMAVWCMWQRCW